MPRKSRIKRIREWLATLGSSVGAVLYPPNVKNALKSVTKNWREYICFYLAALVMAVGFWTLALCNEANLHAARSAVNEAFDYHVEVALLNNEQYANLDQQLSYQMARGNKYVKGYYWVNGDKPLSDGTYSCRIILDGTRGLENAYGEVYRDVLCRISTDRRQIRLSPLYSFRQDFGRPYAAQFWTVSLIWLALSVFMMTVLFLIRLDHFRFVYGIYMTCGADFPKLMGAAGGELVAILALTFLPAALIGALIAGILYIPRGVGLWLSVRAILVPLLGSLAAVLASVWVPVRRMSAQPPVKFLQARDHSNLVSSPRRSFFLFGKPFPGRYELYGFWRMRRYYLRLVLSAVLFAAFFVSGLYLADMKTYHGDLDPYEYLVAYRPSNYYEAVVPEEGEIIGDEPWAPTWEQDELIRSDVDLFLSDVEAIPGVSHAEWEVSLAGGYTQSHLLLKSGQVYDAGEYTVASKERASEGYRWAMNNYAYTAVDQLWIDNLIRNGLATFEGDPYAVLTTPNGVIISEDVYNEKAYDFHPGDKIVVAVCEQAVQLNIVTDPRELLRRQIQYFRFRYETFTVCAVVSGQNTRDTITFGVTEDCYTALTGRPPTRTELKIYMEAGTDMDTVFAAEGRIRRTVSSYTDWVVTPTGNYFEASVKSQKNDAAVILTLAVCLLLISPMVWYFSQIMFYRKRWGEFAALYAMGASDGSFAKLHRLAGGVLSGAAFLITVGVSLLCSRLVFFCVNTLLPKLHITESVRYEFRLSLPALAASVVISVLCGFLSCEWPYRMFKKRRADAWRAE